MSGSALEFGYVYEGDTDSCDHAYTVPAVLRELAHSRRERIVFDAGCGNGVVAHKLNAVGYIVSGVDLSPTGIASANKHYPQLRLTLGSVYDDLASTHGQFPHIISLEVVEHLFDPKLWAKRMFELTEPGGLLLVSTPYHGYLKNVALAVAGKFDQHHDPLWDCGHIKFFSRETLTKLLEQAGFEQVRYRRLGRIPSLAKSMLAIGQRP